LIPETGLEFLGVEWYPNRWVGLNAMNFGMGVEKEK